MINNILQRSDMKSQRNETNSKSQKKTNLTIDEFDGEKLGRSEANAINSIINCTINEKKTNDTSSDSNRFDLLEQMKRKTLTLVVRNSIQIHNLREVTKELKM